MDKKELFGRRKIYTTEKSITRSNVLDVLSESLAVHELNRDDIIYLHKYVRGCQPILKREKEIRDKICNKIVVNRANEIVTFKTANFIGEPLQYVSRGSDASVPQKIEKLNSMMMSENKRSKDMKLANWMFICGLGYRMVLNDKAELAAQNELYDEAPFEIHILDPRNTFVVHASDISESVLMGVTYVPFDKPDDNIYTVYTKDTVYRIKGGEILSEDKYNFGMVPIVEYACNPLRMGAFEVVIDLLDAINLTESNRLDGVEQFIQAIMVLKNVDISREDYLSLKELGAIKLPPSNNGYDTDLYYLNDQLDQSQTQTLIDDMYQEVKEICGIPSQGNANTGDSSNNGAIIMKNGWQNAEARAKETEGMWEESETNFLKIVLKICRDSNTLDLKISDIEPKFGRRNYEDQLTKVQSFVQLVGAGCPPIQAFTISGLVVDPESAALVYEKYQEAQEEKMEQTLKQSTATENKNEEPVTNSSGDNVSEEVIVSEGQ